MHISWRVLSTHQNFTTGPPGCVVCLSLLSFCPFLFGYFFCCNNYVVLSVCVPFCSCYLFFLMNFSFNEFVQQRQIYQSACVLIYLPLKNKAESLSLSPCLSLCLSVCLSLSLSLPLSRSVLSACLSFVLSLCSLSLLPYACHD